MSVHRIAVRDLNQHIVCAICYGYYIDPATITECLHSCEYIKAFNFKHLEISLWSLTDIEHIYSFMLNMLRE